MKLPHNARKEEKRKERRGRWVHTEIAAPITAQCRRLSVCETCATDALILYHMLYYLVNSTWRWRVLSVSSCALPLRRLQPEKERERDTARGSAEKEAKSTDGTDADGLRHVIGATERHSAYATTCSVARYRRYRDICREARSRGDE